MTDKELRKLSRLELLELLLEATKENERLKEKIKKMNDENRTAQKIENLSVATHQVENALKYANTLTDTLKGTSSEAVTTNNKAEKQYAYDKQSPISDRDLYWRLMGFYSKNQEALGLLPDGIRNDVIFRIREILERIKKK